MIWRRSARGGNETIDRFGRTCPVCAAPLGSASPPRDAQTGRFEVAPSFRLEVGPPDGESGYSWRVQALAGNFPPAVSTDPAFSPYDVDFVYLLCGGGHIFPDASPVYHGGNTPGTTDESRHEIEDWNMVAAIGAPASGKTYLLVRMLHQTLNNPTNWSNEDNSGRVRLRKLSPLENLPLSVRAKLYGQTRSVGHAIPPTTTDAQGTPAGILSLELPDALDAIKEIVRRTVVDGERRARTWGTSFRQPLVLRTDTRGRRTWTGVADLPGELFTEENNVQREASKLRRFDALIWVVDPIVAANATDWLAGTTHSADEQRDFLDGSLRPGTSMRVGVEGVRVNRDEIQVDIGRHLSFVDGPFAGDEGQTLQMLVTVSKCDLINAALRKRHLTEIGAPGVVQRGVAGYLAFAANRWARSMVTADELSTALLEYLYGAERAAPIVRQQRYLQVADGLIEHYSDAARFWNLVHEGQPDEIIVAEGTDVMALRRLHLRVPSVTEHLDQALQAGSANQFQFRDLVMSAIGCGIAYGLGHEDALYSVQQEQWQHLRFFLCSPLGTVPVATDRQTLEPLEAGARFPRAQDRSAGLTQLLLAVLGKARR